MCPEGYVVVSERLGNARYGNHGVDSELPALSSIAAQEYMKYLSDLYGIPVGDFHLESIGDVEYVDEHFILPE